MGTGRGSQSHRDSYAKLIVRSLFDVLEIEIRAAGRTAGLANESPTQVALVNHLASRLDLAQSVAVLFSGRDRLLF
jgi:hypothetical protein